MIIIIMSGGFLLLLCFYCSLMSFAEGFFFFLGVTLKPETIKKTLVNQMLLCFGIMFASQVRNCYQLIFCLLLFIALLFPDVVEVALTMISQHSSSMVSLLGIIEQCLKAGKKQSWHAASVTNICVGLLAGSKVLTFLL